MGGEAQQGVGFCGEGGAAGGEGCGVKRKLVGLVVEDRGIIRHGYEIFHEGVKVGEVTSGSYAITLEKASGWVTSMPTMRGCRRSM